MKMPIASNDSSFRQRTSGEAAPEDDGESDQQRQKERKEHRIEGSGC
jgi:hypothetical protein